ncbi:MAG: nickel pincer cofactor biosynthesis protein LarB [Bradymonadaceae bacterium]|nr:nickel pincer cofactor biosynthesis protein LarB [Lujinxingiaceae bacterium]
MSEHIRKLLQSYRQGEIDEEEIVQRLVRQPFEEHLIGRFDQTREARTGIPEAILAEGKDPVAVADIFRNYLERDAFLLATRVTPAIVEGLSELIERLQYFPHARIVATSMPEPDLRRSTVLVLSAGALDRPVAEEAVITSRLLGNPTEFIADVGVAGVARIATELGRLDKCGILIVVAGMDGVLPTFVGGLARQPVIAVPTSVGYGASFNGIAPLLTMLNSCAPGTAVLNIDNGFGAAVLATKINLLLVDRSA